jgi:hypothetical protein
MDVNQAGRVFGSMYVRSVPLDSIRNSEIQAYITEISDAYNMATRDSYLLEEMNGGESRYMSIESFNTLVLGANNLNNTTTTEDKIDNEVMLSALIDKLCTGNKYISRIELAMLMHRKNHDNDEEDNIIIWKNRPKKQVIVEKKIIADVC